MSKIILAAGRDCEIRAILAVLAINEIQHCWTPRSARSSSSKLTRSFALETRLPAARASAIKDRQRKIVMNRKPWGSGVNSKRATTSYFTHRMLNSVSSIKGHWTYVITIRADETRGFFFKYFKPFLKKVQTGFQVIGKEELLTTYSWR